MDIIVAIIAGTALGIGLAAIYFRAHRKTDQQFKLLQEKLVAKEAELEEYRGKINQHFSKTAEIFTDLTENYKSLHGFLAEQSQVLCDNPIDIQLISAQTKKVLPKSTHTTNKTTDKPSVTRQTNKLSPTAEVIHLKTEDESRSSNKKSSTKTNKEFAESE